MARRGLFVLTCAAVIVMACNPLLAPLLPVVDALGLDVLVLLMGAQAMALLPWVRLHARRIARITLRLLLGTLAGAIASFIGGYLRQLVFAMATRWTVGPTRARDLVFGPCKTPWVDVRGKFRAVQRAP